MSLQNSPTRLPRISLMRGPSEGTCRMGSNPLGAVTVTEKAGNIGQLMCCPVPWQRLQENFTIGHALKPGIQQREHAAICLRSNQSPKTLLQRQNRLRYLKFRKRVAPVFLKRLHPGR